MTCPVEDQASVATPTTEDTGESSAESVYSREWLLSVRAFVPVADDLVCLRSIHITPDASPCSVANDFSPTFGQIEGHVSDLSFDTTKLSSKVKPPTATPVMSVPTPAERAAMEEMIFASLQKDIAQATAFVLASADDTVPPSRAGWGKGGDPSQLLNRIRRAPGRTVSLATLADEAPLDLKILLQDPEAFSTWLRHRTGLLQVKGSAGEEYVEYATWAGSKDSAGESAFAFNPQASEFNPWMYGDDCNDCNYDFDEYMTVEEAAMMYYGEGQDGMDCGLPGQEGIDFALPGEMLGDASPGAGAEDLALSAIGPPPGLGQEAEEPPPKEKEIAAEVTFGALNPKAAEFHPTVFLAEYDKARKVGPKSHKVKSRRVASRPCAIPEEPITGSSETASGGEDPATPYEESTSGEDEEEALAEKVAVQTPSISTVASQSSSGL